MKIDWKGLLSSVAPTLATALGGPYAGIAVKAASKALLGKEEATEKELAQAVGAASPQDLLKLREADNELRARLKELGVELEEVHRKDRENARAREVALRDKTPKTIAALVLGGFFLCLGALIFVDLPPSSADPVKILLGALAGMLIQISNYYYGTSASSSRKTELMFGNGRE